MKSSPCLSPVAAETAHPFASIGSPYPASAAVGAARLRVSGLQAEQKGMVLVQGMLPECYQEGSSMAYTPGELAALAQRTAAEQIKEAL
jgi:hypothetical protein